MSPNNIPSLIQNLKSFEKNKTKEYLSKTRTESL